MVTLKRSIKRCVLTALVVYLVYACLTAVVPALLRKPVSPEFAASVRVQDYYGDQPGVDRAALVETPAEGLQSRLHILDEAK